MSSKTVLDLHGDHAGAYTSPKAAVNSSNIINSNISLISVLLSRNNEVMAENNSVQSTLLSSSNSPQLVWRGGGGGGGRENLGRTYYSAL